MHSLRLLRKELVHSGRIKPKMAAQAFVYMNGISALLRARLAKRLRSYDLQTHRLVYALFAAELVRRNFPAALAYADDASSSTPEVWWAGRRRPGIPVQSAFQ